jgi:putative ABC transport system permease protein
MKRSIILALAIKSLRNRKFTVALTMLSIALAVLLLLGVERIRHESRESFAATISGTDLLVGARSSPVHLLLFAVFHIGNATNNLHWESYHAIAANPAVAWTIPLSLGDSHAIADWCWHRARALATSAMRCWAPMSPTL